MSNMAFILKAKHFRVEFDGSGNIVYCDNYVIKGYAHLSNSPFAVSSCISHFFGSSLFPKAQLLKFKNVTIKIGHVSIRISGGMFSARQ